MHYVNAEVEAGADWIVASEARAIAQRTMSTDAEDFLILRCAAGQIRTKCTRIRLYENSDENDWHVFDGHMLEDAFWDLFRNGGSANWTVGDFLWETHRVDAAYFSIQALSVLFSRTDILALLPAAPAVEAAPLTPDVTLSVLGALPSIPPPMSPFVTLSEALTWIAFGQAMNSDSLFDALHRDHDGTGDAERTLTEAVMSLCELASAGLIGLRGKYLESHNMAEETTLTDDIAAIRLTDFRRFDLLYDGLRHGTGLMWKGAGDNLERIMPTGRRDYFVSVSVDRDALMAHFPMQARVSLHEGSRTDEGGLNPRQEGEGPIFWDDFGSDALPELERLNDAAVRDQWWTWPEAIAWIGSRDVKNIATLRYWGQEWFGRDDGERDPTIILGAQDYMARQYCPSPRHALSELHTFIERGEIQTVGRPGRDARSCPLTKEEWRGGEIVYTGGVAVLASSSNKLTAWSFDIAVSRLDLFTAFPVSNGGCAEKVIKERKRPGPAPDKDWPHAIAKVTQDCVAAGYKRQRKRGDKSAIQTMLLNYMAEKDKHFSDDIAAKYAETVIAALPDN